MPSQGTKKHFIILFDSHDNYLRFEEDVEKKELMIDSYENQRDLKLQ